MSTNETIGTISPFLWKLMLEVARDEALSLDVGKGGYYDGRSGCINLWCGPDDKPAGWPADLAMTAGAFPEPRSYLASFSMKWPEEGDYSWGDRESAFPVVADMGGYDLADYQKRQRNRELAEMSPTQRLKLNRPLRPPSGRVAGDLEWVKAKFEAIYKLAEARVPPPLQLELGAIEGDCMTCGGPLRLIVRVLSSPYANGVGDWRHWCSACKTLTQPRSEILAAALAPLPEGSKAIGRVIGWTP